MRVEHTGHAPSPEMLTDATAMLEMDEEIRTCCKEERRTKCDSKMKSGSQERPREVTLTAKVWRSLRRTPLTKGERADGVMSMLTISLRVSPDSSMLTDDTHCSLEAIPHLAMHAMIDIPSQLIQIHATPPAPHLHHARHPALTPSSQHPASPSSAARQPDRVE